MSSIRKEISADTLANQAILERRQNLRTIVLIEGGHDARYFRRFSCRNSAALTVCHDRERVILTLGVLKQRGEVGVLGLIDKDYAQFDPIDPVHHDEDLIETDENDLEVTILKTVIHKLVCEYGTEAKINEILEEGKLIDELIFSEGCKIGALRAISKRDSLNLRFRGMDYKFVANTSFEISLDDTIEEILGQSDCDLDPSDVRDLALDLIGKSQPRELCQGHDCVRILGRSLRREFGSDSQFDKSKSKDNGLYALLRVSHEKCDFEATSLFANIKAWERSNNNWKVLA